MEKAEKHINLAWMYPNVLNLHGDRGNIMAFEKVASELGIKLNVERIDSYNQEIDFENTDILFFSPGELKSIKKIIEVLKNEQKLKDYIEKNKNVILIGTTGALFMKEIIRESGEKLEGLGFLDSSCIERETVIGDDIYFELNDEDNIEIIGSQIQMIDVMPENDKIGLGKIKYGYGNNGSNIEGVKKHNIIFTNALGPVFIKNPWWAEKILREVCIQKGIDIEEVEIDYEIERASFETSKRFIENKIIKK